MVVISWCVVQMPHPQQIQMVVNYFPSMATIPDQEFVVGFYITFSQIRYFKKR